MTMRRMSLRHKLLMGFLAVLLPMLGLIVYDSNAEYSELGERALDEQSRVSGHIAALADASLDAALAIAWSFSKNPVLVTRDYRRIDPYLQGLESLLPQYDDVAVFDAEGATVGSMRLGLSPGAPRPSAADREYFQAVRSGGRPAVSDVLISRVSGRPVVAVAVPMLDDSGNVEGVTIVALDMDHLVRTIGLDEAGGSRAVFMTDHRGTVAFHTGLPAEEWGRRNLSGFSPVRSALDGRAARERAVSTVLGDERIVVAVPTPRYGWVVGVSIPTRDLLQPIQGRLITRVLLYSGAILLAGVVAALLSRRLVLDPLEALERHLGALGRGRLDRRIDLRTGDEIETVAETVNEMAIQLERSTREEERLLQEALESRRRAEESAATARRWSEEMQGLLANLAEGVTIVDRRGEVILMNEVGAQIWRLPRGRLLPKQYRELDLRYPDGRAMPFEQRPVSRALRGEVFSSYEVLFVPGEGLPMRLDFSGSAVLDDRGRVKVAIIVYRDVTRLRELEQQREDYLRIVAHDLRAPLTVIQGQAQLLRRALERSDQDGGRLLNTEAILTGAQRMNAMIQDLVDSVRLESGQLRLEKRSVELGVFVCDLLARCAGAMDVDRVTLRFPIDLPPVAADADRLERILVNLLSNALKYAAPGTEVLVSAARADGEVVTSVADEGPGMGPEDLPHVFDRYYRAPGTRRAEGLGLGLYITRMLVEAQGGRIWAESVPGKGSTFHFTLPGS